MLLIRKGAEAALPKRANTAKEAGLTTLKSQDKTEKSLERIKRKDVEMP